MLFYKKEQDLFKPHALSTFQENLIPKISAGGFQGEVYSSSLFTFSPWRQKLQIRLGCGENWRKS